MGIGAFRVARSGCCLRVTDTHPYADTRADGNGQTHSHRNAYCYEYPYSNRDACAHAGAAHSKATFYTLWRDSRRRNASAYPVPFLL